MHSRGGLEGVVQVREEDQQWGQQIGGSNKAKGLDSGCMQKKREMVWCEKAIELAIHVVEATRVLA